MSYIEPLVQDHECENCGSHDSSIRIYYTEETEETVYHCNTCGYIQWTDQYRS